MQQGEERGQSGRLIPIALFASVISLVIVAFVTLRNTETVARETSWLSRRLSITHDLTAIPALLSEADASVRRMLASGDPAESARLNGLADSLRRLRADLRLHASEMGEPRLAVDSLDAALTRQLDGYAAALRSPLPPRSPRQGQVIGGFPEPGEFPETGRLLRMVFDAERDALSVRVDALHAGTSLARTTAWVGIGFALIMLMGAGRMIRVELTERRRAEGRFRAVVESAPGGVVMVDRQGTIVLVNHEVERLFGYDRNAMVGRPLEMLLPGAMTGPQAILDHRYMAHPSVRAAGTGGDLLGRRRDGSQVPVEVGLNPIETREGAFVLASLVDATPRRQAEETQARLAEIVKSSEDAIISKDLSGIITSWNPGAEQLFGYSAQEAVGQPMTLIFPPHLVDEEAVILAAIKGGQAVRHYEAPRVRKDGSTIEVSISVSPVADRSGRIVGASKIARDITTRKRADARFRNVVESSPSGMLMVGRDGRITLVNREVERLFGYRREELLGLQVERLVPERIRAAHPGIRAAFFGEARPRDMSLIRDLYGVRKDGTEIPVEIGLNPIETDEGLFVLASVVDISARKQAELELRRSNEELERFAYVASHDLQEPLRMVASFVQLLARRYQGKLDADADEFIGYALDGALRMQRLIQDLLAYSRVGREGAAVTRVSSSEVLDGVLRSLQLAIDESGATVVHDRLPVVLVDRGQLEHLLLNLVSNALKFRGERPPTIRISARRVDASWQFTIEDNGIGIEPQYFERIFVLFQRLHTRDEYDGTGIGLAIAKKIVERHGGRIWLESVPGSGSTFHFTLPADRGVES